MTGKHVTIIALALGLVVLVALPAAAGDRSGNIPGYVLLDLQRTCLELNVQTGELNTISEVALLVSSPNQRVRAKAAYALGESRNPEAVKHLVPLLKDQDHHVQRITATALGKIGDRGPAANLVALLNNTQQVSVKVAVIGALGHIGGDQSVAAVESCSTSQCGWLRHAVAEANERLASSQKVVAQR